MCDELVTPFLSLLLCITQTCLHFISS